MVEVSHLKLQVCMPELLLSVKPLFLKAFIYCFCMAVAIAVASAVLVYQLLSVHIPGQELIWAMKWKGYSESEIAAAEIKHRKRLSKLAKESELPLFGSGAILGLLSGVFMNACLTRARRDFEAGTEETPTEPSSIPQ